MTYEYILMLISLVLFDGYLIYVVTKYGISRSISRTYYYLNKTDRWVFIAVQIGFSVPLILTFESHLLTMGATFICFSALAADTRTHETTMKIHTIGATGGIILGMATMLEFGFWWIPALFFPVAFIFMKTRIKNHTWWIEVIAYHLVILGLFLEIH